MKYAVFFILLIAIPLLSISQVRFSSLQSGDLLFEGKGGGALSNAISEVTQTNLATQYAHIGIIEKSDDQYFLLHAAPASGTARVPLLAYLLEAIADSNIIDIYRIQHLSATAIDRAILSAKSRLGLPYNFSYVMNDSAYYCSDFVYTCLEAEGVFSLAPMTFKQKDSDGFHSTWVDYYQKIGIPIPEGKLGCNPNGMAASERLVYLGTLVMEVTE